MTTIAYRDGVMAGETLGTGEGSDFKFPGPFRKIYRLKDGSMVGFCGAADQCELLLQSLKKKLPPPKLDNCEALLVHPDKKVSRFEGLLWSNERAPYYACGSGEKYAYAAMEAGTDAKTAVNIAKKFDPLSGGTIQVLKLKPKRKKRK